MWVLSVVVLAISLLFGTHQSLPPEVVDFLYWLAPTDGSPSASLVAAGFAAGVVLEASPAKLLFRYFSTAVHELGHAFMAGALFARPKTILIHPSSSGLATFELSPNWGRFRSFLVSAAGYPAPSIAALAAIQAVQLGHSQAWAVFSMAVLAIAIVLLIRNFWGFIWTTGVVVGSYFVLKMVSAEWVGVAVAGIAGFLAMNGIEFAQIQRQLVRQAPGSGVDAEAISHVTGLSPRLVALGHLLACMGISGAAGYFAIQPYWSEIQNWATNLL
ncbi:MAG: M50 family metallopeptidase [Ilumatobacteraceae bacterium]|jgi:hypothetical protein|nr:M50 family metallopeptidase [Ilumatobacteraceae bacterium]